MTQREFFEAFLRNEATDEMKEYAEKQLEKLDAAAAKKAEKQAEVNLADQLFIDKILNEILNEKPVTASEVGGILGVSPQKATVLLKKAMAQNEAITVNEIKSPTSKGKVKGYALA